MPERVTDNRLKEFVEALEKLVEESRGCRPSPA
jgi:hypothetical protein